MHNLLIVDDEMIAVQAIAKGMDWSDLPIGSIYEAYDFEEAAEILRSERIDVLITDIEMPGKNGLELLDFAHSLQPDIISIITTGHANFDYAHKAIQFGSLHYLLKPLDFRELKKLIAAAVTKIMEKKNVEQFYAAYDQFQKHRDQQLPLLRERFWQDLVNQRVMLTEERVEAAATLYDIPITAHTKVVPILISIEQWHKELNTRDEEIMEYALRNAAAEIILGSRSGQVLQERNGSNLVLVFTEGQYGPEQSFSGQLYAQCSTYIEKCAEYFHCSLSCYIGELSSLDELSAMFLRLVEHEKENVVLTNAVLFHSSSKTADTEGSASFLPDFERWITMLETGQKQPFVEQVCSWFDHSDADTITARRLKDFYNGYIRMFYQVISMKGLRPGNLAALDRMEKREACLKSVHLLKQWALQLADEYFCYQEQEHAPVHSSCVAEAIAYIEQHMDEELSREQIAGKVHLNSAYLSRLFKKETGLSLSDYIMKLRMEKAKELLREPRIKISQAASSVGYSHFSHFAKMFKRIIGQTPQEYRKGFMNHRDETTNKPSP
ncbi:response regulator transcription factor [Paenibacillus gansuensis]|uniref:Helix-turn-helix domain-containing protein n=1 Tax=Paenibacillus gansuensis TaxID=306542 RepID=A0ABW5PCM4_9BACL